MTDSSSSNSSDVNASHIDIDYALNAIFDEWIGDYSDKDNNSNSSNSCDDESSTTVQHLCLPQSSIPSTTAAQPKRRRTAAPRKHRVLPKAEITQLRNHIHALETQLLELREDWKRTAAQLPTTSTRSDVDSSAIHTPTNWQHTATCERNARSAAEAANTAMRATYERHRTTARAMRKLLLQRPTSLPAFNTALCFLPVRSPQQVFAASASVYESLVRDVEPMLLATAGIEQLLTARRLERQESNSTYREWHLLNAAAACYSDMSLECIDVFALPFHYEQVATAFRNAHDASRFIHTNAQKCEFFERGDDATTLRQTIFAYDRPDRQGFVQTHDVTSFAYKPSHVVIVSITRIAPVTATGDAIAGIVLREQKWTIVRNEDVHDDDKRTTSLVQSYYKITCDEISQAFATIWTARLIMQSLIPAWNVSIADARAGIDASLMAQCMDAA